MLSSFTNIKLLETARKVTCCSRPQCRIDRCHSRSHEQNSSEVEPAPKIDSICSSRAILCFTNGPWLDTASTVLPASSGSRDVATLDGFVCFVLDVRWFSSRQEGRHSNTVRDVRWVWPNLDRLFHWLRIPGFLPVHKVSRTGIIRNCEPFCHNTKG